MNAAAATGGMQWQQGGVLVAFDVAPAEVTAGLSRLWQRISDGLDALSPEDWERPSRCLDWAVVDVANHLADTGTWVASCMDAAAAGRRTEFFTDFDPIRIPKQLTDAADRSPAVVRRRLADSLDGLRDRLSALDEDAARDGLVETPLGQQPPAAGLAHLFWDTWLHERDVFLALGGDVPVLAEDVRLAALYSLRMEAYIQTLMHREVHVGLELHGALEETLVLDVSPGATRVAMLRDGDAAPPTLLRGDAASAVDALSGRGDVAAALEGPADVRSSISVLRTVLAGR
jgi:uncharacterized protein (TIGR03083 family)